MLNDEYGTPCRQVGETGDELLGLLLSSLSYVVARGELRRATASEL